MDEFNTKQTIIKQKCKVFGEIISNDDLIVIGEVKGNIQCENNVAVSGVVVGNVEADVLYVCGSGEVGPKEGAVYGNVTAQECETNGKIKGDSVIKSNMSLGEQATVIGEINAASIEIKKGAAIRGNLNISR